MVGLSTKFKVFFISILFLWSCHPDNHPGKALLIFNNSSERVYFWYSKQYDMFHYPDTLLPVQKPIYFNSAPANGGGGAGGYDPNWQKIYSQLPAGLFSVYFFDHAPQTQEEWEEIRENYAILARKDVTLEELRANDYNIYYP